MSENRFDFEPASLHLRRFISRCYKQLKGSPLSIEDISVVQVRSSDDTSYEARRNTSGGWTVYRICSSSYGLESRKVFEALCSVSSINLALEELQHRCPQCLGQNALDYNHPAQVAKTLKPVEMPQHVS